jgi:hypothetical protein
MKTLFLAQLTSPLREVEKESRRFFGSENEELKGQPKEDSSTSGSSSTVELSSDVEEFKEDKFSVFFGFSLIQPKENRSIAQMKSANKFVYFIN